MATGKLIGTDDLTPLSSSGGYFTCCKFQALATGIITEFRLKSAVAGYVKFAIYADSGGEPGALLGAQNTGQLTAIGWNTFSITSTPVVKDSYYWLSTCPDTTPPAGIVTHTLDAGLGFRYKAVTYSSFTFPDPAGSGFSSDTATRIAAGWGILVLSPSSISQAIALGAPKLNFILYPSGIVQAIVYGTPLVGISGIVISPQGIAVIISCGTPTLRYPQSISPSSIVVTIAYGTPSVGILGIIVPQSIVQQISIGSPTLLKYVWHVILDGQYIAESPDINRAYVIGRDAYGNPIYGEAHDSAESSQVGERLDFTQELAIPTTAQAGDVASAILAKMRLRGKGGVILIPPNCGQELFDVVQITDAGANQAAVSFRVVGIRFEYNPKQARYQHKLILGAP